MVGKRRSRGAKPELGDSWVDAESSGDETLDSERTIQQSPQPSKASPRSSPAQSKLRARKTPTQSEPEFIMPSIHEEAPPPKLPARKQATPSKTRRTAAKSSRASGKAQTDVMDVIKGMLWWMMEIVGGAFSKMKTPLSYILAAYLLVGLLIVAKNILFSNVYRAIYPVCRVPGVSMLGFEICKAGDAKFGTSNVRFNEVMTAQSRFEDILDKTADAVGLPADMKHSETHMRDLRTRIKYSHLRSKNELELELTGFIDTARKAAWDLQTFDSRIAGAVDSILSSTRYTQRELETLDVKKSDEGAIAAFFSRTILAPFQPLRSTDALVDGYVDHMSLVKRYIGKLLSEATALLDTLENLEDRLEIIHGIAMRDDSKANIQRDELLAQIWTMVGGNRAKLGSIDSQIKVLRQVNHYRKTAFDQVSSTLVELKKMDTDLDELHGRIGSAEAIKEGDIPIWQHVESLRLGAERLEDRRNNQQNLREEHNRALLEHRRQFAGDTGGVPEIEGR